MTKKIGEYFSLSKSASVTLYHDGNATLIKGDTAIVLYPEEVAALRHAFAAQEAAEARATLEAMRDELTTEPGFPYDYNPKDL